MYSFLGCQQSIPANRPDVGNVGGSLVAWRAGCAPSVPVCRFLEQRKEGKIAGRLRELKLSESFWSGRWESNRAAVAGLASARNRSSDHRMYFTRSFGRHRPRNALACKRVREQFPVFHVQAWGWDSAFIASEPSPFYFLATFKKVPQRAKSSYGRNAVASAHRRSGSSFRGS